MRKVLESCLTHHLSSIDVSPYILNIIVSRAPQRIPREKLLAVRSPYRLWSRAGGESSSLGTVLFQMQNYAQQNGTKSTQNDPLATMLLRDVFGSSFGPSHFPPPQPSCPHYAWTTCLLTKLTVPHMGVQQSQVASPGSSYLLPSAFVARTLSRSACQLNLAPSNGQHSLRRHLGAP